LVWSMYWSPLSVERLGGCFYCGLFEMMLVFAMKIFEVAMNLVVVWSPCDFIAKESNYIDGMNTYFLINCMCYFFGIFTEGFAISCRFWLLLTQQIPMHWSWRSLLHLFQRKTFQLWLDLITTGHWAKFLKDW
jgi:hypothetical protein